MASTMISTGSFTLLVLCGLMMVVIAGETEVRSIRNVTYMHACPYSWFHYGTRCFRFVHTARTWAESEQYCVMIGGNLASVHNKKEYNFIKDLVRRHTHDSRITWIGGYDALQEGLWLWSDGSRFDYTHWYPGEPNNYGKREHCLVINFKDLRGWNDGQCSDRFSSVCSRYP
ncbi:ladderlectin-like [Alosa alosa]|uniref:ladderlectin-like n=1 Tax=Alosa alosa TaxID=278164 RepID=UPI0020154A36|nr:ladderlectin-like [Alosa alosa]